MRQKRNREFHAEMLGGWGREGGDEGKEKKKTKRKRKKKKKKKNRKKIKPQTTLSFRKHKNRQAKPRLSILPYPHH